jgi:hypothetical protein
VRKDKPKDKKKGEVCRDGAKPEVERLVDESIARWEAGDNEAALAAAGEALALDPGSSDAHHWPPTTPRRCSTGPTST